MTKKEIPTEKEWERDFRFFIWKKERREREVSERMSVLEK